MLSLEAVFLILVCMHILHNVIRSCVLSPGMHVHMCAVIRGCVPNPGMHAHIA